MCPGHEWDDAERDALAAAIALIDVAHHRGDEVTWRDQEASRVLLEYGDPARIAGWLAVIGADLLLDLSEHTATDPPAMQARLRAGWLGGGGGD
jgi:hypothetical protein